MLLCKEFSFSARIVKNDSLCQQSCLVNSLKSVVVASLLSTCFYNVSFMYSNSSEFKIMSYDTLCGSTSHLAQYHILRRCDLVLGCSVAQLTKVMQCSCVVDQVFSGSAHKIWSILFVVFCGDQDVKIFVRA